MDEHDLIHAILESRDSNIRDRLIRELDRLPVSEVPFHERWRRIYEVQGECWSEEGYRRSRSQWPRDIELLKAAELGCQDVLRGGFNELFKRPPGTVAPELQEWFERVGLSKAASVVKEAIGAFEFELPEAQDERFAVQTRFRKEIASSRWKRRSLFQQLNREFRNTVNADTLVEAKDRWIKKVCGIQTLCDLPDGVIIHRRFVHRFAREFWEDAIRHPGTGPIDQTIDEVLSSVHYGVISTWPQRINLWMTSGFGDSFDIRLNHEDGTWVAQTFWNGSKDLLKEPDAQVYQEMMIRVLDRCREELTPTGSGWELGYRGDLAHSPVSFETTIPDERLP